MAHNLKRADIKYMFRFIKEKKAELYVLGINIHVPEGNDIDSRFGEVLVQLQRLRPDKQTMFNSLKERYVSEQREALIVQKIQELKEQKAEAERCARLSKMSAAKAAAIEKCKYEDKLDGMPDCAIKF